jgi:hypothetical protein
MPEWTKFCVDTSKGFDRNGACARFDTISHIAHIGTALSITSVGEIRPTLVFDESKLNDKRILVTWLSPNYWSRGFRYGTVRFQFSPTSLLRGKRYYWVESIAYKIAACRILVTDIDRDSQLPRYDPEIPDGPWWYDAGKGAHYFNSRHCLEFMFESSVSLNKLTRLDFVPHHGDFCSAHRYNQTSCEELGMRKITACGRFVTRAMLTAVDLAPYADCFFSEKSKLGLFSLAFFDFMTSFYPSAAFDGPLGIASPASPAVIRAVMMEFTFGRLDEARKVATLFESYDAFFQLAYRAFTECARTSIMVVDPRYEISVDDIDNLLSVDDL